MGIFNWLRGGTVDLAEFHVTSLEQIIAQASLDSGDYYTTRLLSIAAVFRARQLLADRLSALPVVTAPGVKAPAPNSDESWYDVVGAIMLSLQDTGDAYLKITSDGFRVLPASGMQVNWSDVPKIRRRRVYTFENQPMRTRGVTRNLLVISINRRVDDLTGTGWMESGAITNVLASQEYESSYFRNNAQPSGVLQVPGNVTPDEAQLLKEQWDANHVSRSTAVISASMSYTPTSFNATDSQMSETHLVSIGDVANLSGVPAFLLAYSPPGSTQDYQNVETVLVRLWRETLEPSYAVRLEEAFTDIFRVAISFDPRGMFLSSMLNRSAAVAAFVGAGYDPADVLDTVGVPEMSVAPVQEVLDVGAV